MKTLSISGMQLTCIDNAFEGVNSSGINLYVQKSSLKKFDTKQIEIIINYFISNEDSIIYNFSSKNGGDGRSNFVRYNDRIQSAGKPSIHQEEFCEKCKIASISIDDYDITVLIDNDGMFGDGVSELSFSHKNILTLAQASTAQASTAQASTAQASTAQASTAQASDMNTLISWVDFDKIGKADRLQVNHQKKEISYFVGQYLKSRFGGENHPEFQHLAMKVALKKYIDKSDDLERASVAKFLDSEFGNRKPKGSPW